MLRGYTLKRTRKRNGPCLRVPVRPGWEEAEKLGSCSPHATATVKSLLGISAIALGGRRSNPAGQGDVAGADVGLWRSRSVHIKVLPQQKASVISGVRAVCGASAQTKDAGEPLSGSIPGARASPSPPTSNQML